MNIKIDGQMNETAKAEAGINVNTNKVENINKNGSIPKQNSKEVKTEIPKAQKQSNSNGTSEVELKVKVNGTNGHIGTMGAKTAIVANGNQEGKDVKNPSNPEVHTLIYKEQEDQEHVHIDTDRPLNEHNEHEHDDEYTKDENPIRKEEKLSTQKSFHAHIPIPPHPQLSDLNPHHSKSGKAVIDPHFKISAVTVTSNLSIRSVPEHDYYDPDNDMQIYHKTPIEVLAEHSSEDRVRLCNMVGLTLVYAIGFFCFGYGMGAFNSIQGNLGFDLKWKEEEKNVYRSVISGMIPTGAVIGSTLQGVIAKKIGRRWTFIIADLLSILSIAINMVANTYVIIIARLICGIGVGVYALLVPEVIHEYIPKRYQGICSAVYNVVFNCGLITTFSLGTNIQPKDKEDLVWWRIVFAIPIVLILFNMIMLLTKYNLDTPLYYMKQKNKEKCMEAFREVYLDEENITLATNKIEKDIEKQEKEGELTYSVLFSKRYSKQLFVGIVFNLGIQFTGVLGLNFYSSFLFKKSSSDKTAVLFTALLAVSKFAGSIVSLFVFGKLKNKTVLLTGFSVTFSCLLSVSILQYFGITEPQKYLFMLFYFTIGGALFIVFKVNAELLPIRGVGMLGLFHWVSGIGVTYAFPFMIDSALNVQWTFIVFAGLTLVNLILTAVFYKETHGLTLREVEELYSTWC